MRIRLVAIVILVGHKVSAAHIEPFDPVEETTETLFDGIERQAQMFGAGLAQHVEMQSFHPGGQAPSGSPAGIPSREPGTQGL